MKRNLISILVVALISVSTAYSQVGYLTMREGLAKAMDASGMINPLLVNAFTFNGEITGLPLIGTLQVETIFQGTNIGKSNAWLYTFVEADSYDFVTQVGAFKVLGQIVAYPSNGNIDFGEYGVELSFTNPIDLSQLIDSDEFIKKLVQNSLHSVMQNACLSECVSVIGVGTVANEYLCLQPGETNWLRIVSSFDAEFCCSTPYNNADLLNCANYTTRNYFTMRQGLEVAKEKAKEVMENPIWVAVSAEHYSSVTLENGVTIQNEIINDGEKIGSAIFWDYIFREKGNSEQLPIAITVIELTTGEFVVAKYQEWYSSTSEFISYLEPIDEEKAVDSDEFAASLISPYLQNPAYLEHTIMSLQIYSYSEGFAYCFLAEEDGIDWWSEIEVRYNYTPNWYEYLCCYAPYSDVSEINCEFLWGAVKENADNIPISIFPTPATSIVTISNPEELLISSITVYDILGNKIADISANATEINISNFVAGNYFICFTVGNKKIYRSLVVNN